MIADGKKEKKHSTVTFKVKGTNYTFNIFKDDCTDKNDNAFISLGGKKGIGFCRPDDISDKEWDVLREVIQADFLGFLRIII
jgi:hypothetical protein